MTESHCLWQDRANEMFRRCSKWFTKLPLVMFSTTRLLHAHKSSVLLHWNFLSCCLNMSWFIRLFITKAVSYSSYVERLSLHVFDNVGERKWSDKKKASMGVRLCQTINIFIFWALSHVYKLSKATVSEIKSVSHLIPVINTTEKR